ncbi:MAG: carbohydrate kinase family protein [Oscillospiraceae bacterium]|nr:carbohydrate kinase family protein [Oscillospiraceae bacterium]
MLEGVGLLARILVSGLVNVETTCKVRQFPVEYYPIDYPFFGVQSGPSGVAYNIAKALRSLGGEVQLLSMTGDDFQAAYIRQQLHELGVDTAAIRAVLRQTPSSVVLYDDTGRRQVYCDLKDIQETAYPVSGAVLEGADLAVLCNINFNRPLLRFAKEAGKKIATDVHVLANIHDGYNKEFMEHADILFLSDEAVGEDYRGFLRALYQTYGNEIVVLGRGSKGAALCHQGQILELPAVQVGPVVNTVGAGDALFTAFNHYYAKGLEPVAALVRAELFASNKICVSGGAQGFVSEKKIEEDYLRFGDGILDQIQVFPL